VKLGTNHPFRYQPITDSAPRSRRHKEADTQHAIRNTYPAPRKTSRAMSKNFIRHSLLATVEPHARHTRTRACATTCTRINSYTFYCACQLAIAHPSIPPRSAGSATRSIHAHAAIWLSRRDSTNQPGVDAPRPRRVLSGTANVSAPPATPPLPNPLSPRSVGDHRGRSRLPSFPRPSPFLPRKISG
jgi:hypothetical protein